MTRGRAGSTSAPDCIRLTLPGTPDLLALHEANPRRYPHLLESAVHGTAQARYDILFAFPGDTLVAGPERTLMRNHQSIGQGDFLAALDDTWQVTASTRALSDIDVPFSGGWFAFFAYDLVAQIEPRLAYLPIDRRLPLASITRFPAAVIHDHAQRETYLICEPEYERTLVPEIVADARQAATMDIDNPTVVNVREDDPKLYLDGIRRVQEYIRAGDVFQVNLSRGWEVVLGRPNSGAAVYRCLRAANPAPFAGLMTFDNGVAIISSSPERLVAVEGDAVHTRPIAGTYPRSTDAEEDRAWAQALLSHPKERAEHVMLIDLERNDLGRLCRPGTVHVRELMGLESYRHVHHIVSEVRGELRKGVTPGQVIRATFPGGTITGCPKIRCMEIIAELEPEPRGAYTGSFGYINRDGSMDLNILIRTFVLQENRLAFRAGAGIVADSIPERELNETRAKAKGLLAALGLA